jgi:hypothetical protein
LLKAVKESSKELARTKGPSAAFEIVDAERGVVELSGGERFELRPLDELYGAGVGAATVDPMDDRYMPLFLAIEEAIQLVYRANRGLTDGAVHLALSELSMNPSAETRDVLARAVQFQLRLLLSLDDYSRQDVKGAVRKIAKSVERHTKSGGPRGYLEFVRRTMRM